VATVEDRRPSPAGLGSGLDDGRRAARRALLLIALAAVLANAVWFSATAVVPALQRDWHLTSAQAAWLVIAVQLGVSSSASPWPGSTPPRYGSSPPTTYADAAWPPGS
jgi:hypothetical protein